MYDLVILTTAIDRPELHSKVFPATLDYLKGLKCKWYITINNTNNRVKATKENFESLLKDYDVEIYTYETGGTQMDFMRSCEQLAKYGHLSNPSIGYFWLEDDWLVPSNQILKSDLTNLIKESSYHISLANRNDLSFNPGIWSSDLFDKLIYTNLKSAHERPEYGIPNRSNPERYCTYPVDVTRKAVKNFYKINRYQDVGRAWQSKNGYSKNPDMPGGRTWNLNH